ncbi:hypothetical protein BS78_01G490700 [Paspalum vaginatum]|nr:hypothetical protein BS78_01G490700 [Paspalum vaginatum]
MARRTGGSEGGGAWRGRYTPPSSLSAATTGASAPPPPVRPSLSPAGAAPSCSRVGVGMARTPPRVATGAGLPVQPPAGSSSPWPLARTFLPMQTRADGSGRGARGSGRRIHWRRRRRGGSQRGRQRGARSAEAKGTAAVACFFLNPLWRVVAEGSTERGGGDGPRGATETGSWNHTNF